MLAKLRAGSGSEFKILAGYHALMDGARRIELLRGDRRCLPMHGDVFATALRLEDDGNIPHQADRDIDV